MFRLWWVPCDPSWCSNADTSSASSLPVTAALSKVRYATVQPSKAREEASLRKPGRSVDLGVTISVMVPIEAQDE